MSVFLCRTKTAGFSVPPIDLSLYPCPTIMAGGIAGGNCSQYFLEDDGKPDSMPPCESPPYHVPSMEEIEAIPPNGFNVVSTFSGCGGSCLGYRMAGFKILYANEFIPAAQEVYRANHPTSILDTRDIRTVKPSDILDQIGLGPREIDLFDGSPPCASFSTAGKREEGWGKVKDYSDTKQRTDDLFFEYIRLLRGLQPKVFVAENVSGLVKGTAKGYFIEILKAMKVSGYRVKAKVLDAKYLGVPQSRQRLIFIGVREDLNREPVHPKPQSKVYSVRDAIPWISKAWEDTGGEWSMGEITDRTSPTVRAGGVGHLFVEAESDISRYSTGAEWEKVAIGGQSEKYFNLVKADPEKPSPTILASHGSSSVASVVHPTEKRKFSIAELKRICAFPDDFILTGTYAQQWERLGRAVPPLMMKAIAETVRDEILLPLSEA